MKTESEELSFPLLFQIFHESRLLERRGVHGVEVCFREFVADENKDAFADVGESMSRLRLSCFKFLILFISSKVCDGCVTLPFDGF